MELNFFEYLPSEITINIISRLSIRNLTISKSVCKPWLNLIDSDDFLKFEIKTPPALVLFPGMTMDSTCCFIFEIEDEDEKSNDFHHIPLMDLEIPHGNRETMDGITANGLLLLYPLLYTKDIPVYICNLISREYTELCCPADYIPGHLLEFGFGVSKISGQYKVVCINLGTDSHNVYTLGIGSWWRVEADAASGFRFHGQSIVCSGNLHWIVFDLSHNIRICGFDVETECFRIFSGPPMGHGDGDLSVLRDSLCYSYTYDHELVIWMMKEYQVEDSWTIEFKLSTIGFDFDLDYICADPVKHFKDGNILMLVDETDLIYYSIKTRTFQRVVMFKYAAAKDYVSALIFTPSLFSLKNFGFENVISF